MRTRTMIRMAIASAFAATVLACSAQTCGLDQRNRKNIALPSASEIEVNASSMASLRRAFELLATPNRARDAGPIFERTRSLAAHTPCGEALAEFGLGESASAEKLAEALPHYERAEALLKQTGTPMAVALVEARIAVLHHLHGDEATFTQSAPNIEQQLRDAGDVASALKLQSLVLQNSSNLQQPDAQAQLVHELEGIDTENVPAVRGYLQWAWGLSLRRTGRYSEITGHFQAALADLSACGCEPETKAAVLLNMAAAADSTGTAEMVLQYATEADDLYRAYGLVALRGQSMRLLAAAYAHQRNWPKAIAEYHAGLALAEQQHAATIVSSLRTELAAAYGDSGNPRAGLTTLALLVQNELTPTQRCSAQAQKAVLEGQAKQFDPAITDGEQALASCKDLLQPVVAAQVERTLSDALLASGQTEPGVEHARKAIAIIDTQRPRTRPTDSALIQFNENQHTSYTLLIRALVQAGRAEEALIASEEGRARAFVDLITTSHDGKALPRQSDDASRGRATAGTKDNAEFSNRPQPLPMSRSDLRATIESHHSTLIAYWLGDDRLYTWVLSPEKPVIEFDQPMTPLQLASLVRATLPAEQSSATRGALVRTRGGAAQSVLVRTRRPWADLYNVLIAPIAANLPAQEGSLLTVVPQGPLFQLSFSALRDADHRYLIERYALHQIPSIGMLQAIETSAAASPARPTRYIVLANPEKLPEVHGVPLPALPGTEAEARDIAQQIGDKVTVLEGRQAGIDDLKRLLPDAAVVHFATHSVVNDTAPGASFLALDTRQQGGKLTAELIYGLKLHAGMVVLSACSTGRGTITGDGVLGLSRAFFYAGSESLVTTLWDVVDAPTARLMPEFYGELAHGASRSEALRQAQISLIHALRSHRVRVPTLIGTRVNLPEDPAYWAAFQLSGRP